MHAAARRARLLLRNNRPRRLLDRQIDIGIASPGHRYDAIALHCFANRIVERLCLGAAVAGQEPVVGVAADAKGLIKDFALLAGPSLRKNADTGPLDGARVVELP